MRTFEAEACIEVLTIENNTVQLRIYVRDEPSLYIDSPLLRAGDIIKLPDNRLTVQYDVSPV